MKTPSPSLHHAVVSRLKVRQLALLQAIDRHRTLNRVAAEMRLSQPAITKALHEVEDIFGCALFERSSRGLKPTPAGQAVLHYAHRWLADLESTTQALTAIDAGRSGRMRIGLIHQVPQGLLAAALRHLLEQQPRMAVLAREGTTDELVSALHARELDCAIGRSFDGESSEIVQQPIYQQEPCLVVPAASLKRLSRGALDWAALAALDWIMPPANSPMRRTYNAIFVGAGAQPPLPLMETISLRSTETVMRNEPNAITILPRDVAAELGPHCAALPYKLSWNLPPVSFFVPAPLAHQPAMAALSAALSQAARAMGHAALPR